MSLTVDFIWKAKYFVLIFDFEVLNDYRVK